MSNSKEGLGFLGTAKATLLRFKAHNVMVIAAGIAFFGFLALIPTMIATMSIYGLVADPAEIPNMVDGASGLEEGTKAFLVKQLEGMTESKSLGLATGLGIALALFSASGAVQKLMNTISVAYATIEERKGLKVRGLAFLFTVGAIVGFVAMILGFGILPAFADRLGLSGPVSVLTQVTVYPLMMLAMYLAFTVLYRYGPDRHGKRTPWRNVGAMVGTILFVLFALALSTYSRLAGGMPASYAILGAFASIMIFLQLAAIAVVVGAEVNAVVEGEGMDPTRSGQPAQTILVAASTETLSLGKAMAGVAAIFFLGRGDR